MKHFSASTHVNPTSQEFIGNSWEEGGFSVRDDGSPCSDVRGNTVAACSVRDITADDFRLLAEAYAGDEPIDNAEGFLCFLCRECGLDASTARQVCDNLGFTPTQEDWNELELHRQADETDDPADKLRKVIGLE